MLRAKVERYLLPLLLPNRFTLTEHQRICEAVLGRAIDRGAFRASPQVDRRPRTYSRCFRGGCPAAGTALSGAGGLSVLIDAAIGKPGPVGKSACAGGKSIRVYIDIAINRRRNLPGSVRRSRRNYGRIASAWLWRATCASSSAATSLPCA